MQPFGTGYIPTNRNSKDWLIYKYSAPLPDSIKTDLSMIPILMQAKTPACVAHAITRWVQYLIYKENGSLVKLSPRFLYAKTIEKMGTDPNNGSDLRTALDIAQKIGICEESFLPNDTDLPANQYADVSKITPEALQNALQYRIGAYYFLNDTNEASIMEAISQWGCVLYGIQLSDSWWTPSWEASDILPLKPPKGPHDPTLSSHLILGTGFDSKPYRYFDNSWSNKWGDKGSGYFGADDFPYVYEAAVIEGLRPKTLEENQNQQIGLLKQWILLLKKLLFIH